MSVNRIPPGTKGASKGGEKSRRSGFKPAELGSGGLRLVDKPKSAIRLTDKTTLPAIHIIDKSGKS